MSEAYERERQNNSRLDELASKVTSLRDVTINIYDNARDQHIIDDSNDLFQNFGTSLKQSAGRITRMASSGTKTQTLRMAAIATGTVVFLYLVWGGASGKGVTVIVNGLGGGVTGSLYKGC